jgi:hypothetical protein
MAASVARPKAAKTAGATTMTALAAPRAKPSEPRAEKSSPAGDSWENF